MTALDQIDIYSRLCEGLSKRPGESLNTAAGRALSLGPPSARKAASVVLRPSTEPVWDRMARAAKVLDS